MPQFTLICTDEDSTVTTKEFDAMLLKEVVEKTQDFLERRRLLFEELHTQVHPLPQNGDDADDYASLYRDVELNTYFSSLSFHHL